MPGRLPLLSPSSPVLRLEANWSYTCLLVIDGEGAGRIERGGDPQGENEHRRAVNAWILYDCANSAYFTTVVAAVFPPFYRSLVLQAGGSAADATAYWAYTTSASLALVAVLGPILGAVADLGGGKKGWLTLFAAVGIVSAACMVLLQDGSYRLASLLFAGGTVGVTGSLVFYDALLPHVARPDELHRVSARGYAVGYLGGGILLLFNLLLILFPEACGLQSRERAIQVSFFSVAVWWAVFTIPLLRHVPEPRVPGKPMSLRSAVAQAWPRLRNTFRHLRRYRQLALFLLAFLVYSDGIGTIIKMATAYGDELGIDLGDLIGALLVTQFVGIPCSFAFGRLAGRIGAKPAILCGLGVYTGVSVLAFFMQTAAHFYLLALLVGMVQGGTQALSRSLFGSMVPRHRSAEFFGFFSTSEKLAGIVGPFLFGFLVHQQGEGRAGILLLAIFFVVGGLLLSFVDEAEGRRLARQEEASTGGVDGG
ncbi:MAG TPA: MFS transporter [Acidobacteriota bacterium]|nr:MFS transporter [Acidobacteriota bacterium]